MTIDIDGKIAQANGRLRSAKVGVTIERHGDRLYLRATFPPKPNSKKVEWYQQRLSIGHANHNSLQAAEKEARKIGALLDSRDFVWDEYLKPKEDGTAKEIIEWIEQLRHQHFADGKSEVSWRTDYWLIYKNLPLDKPLDYRILERAIISTSPNTRTRKRAVQAIAKLAKVAGIEQDFGKLAGSYHGGEVARELPDDRLIAEYFHQIKNPAWRWVFGMIATYGLRPHEVFRLDYDYLRRGERILRVQENTKTGFRMVWAFYPEWFQEFGLSEVLLPAVDLGRSNDGVGNSASKYFYNLNCPFQLYDLRHRWAIRTLEFGLDISLSARQMGHSVEVHSKTYHRWITADTHQKAYEIILANPNRPKLP